MKKKLILLVTILALLTASAPLCFGASEISPAMKTKLNSKEVCYTPAGDYWAGDCILTATKVMIRRASIIRGSKTWNTITNKTLRLPATIFGLLLHNFKFEADGLSYRVQVGYLRSSGKQARIREFERLIETHPEGVVVWGSRSSIFGMHGVLLTDVKDGVAYVMDSYYNKGSYKMGIQRWEDSSMQDPEKCSQYWAISEVSIAKKTAAPEKGKPLAPASASKSDIVSESMLDIRNQTVPVEVMQGKGFAVRGSVSSNYRLTDVTLDIFDSKDEKAVTKSVDPENWSFDLAKWDDDVKFGKLAPGEYTYKVTASDEKTSKVLVNAKFKITKKNK